MTPNKTPLVTSQLPIPQISRHPTRSYSFRFTSLMTHPSSYDLLHHSSSTIFSLLHSSSTIISLLFMYQSSLLSFYSCTNHHSFTSIHLPIIPPFSSSFQVILSIFILCTLFPYLNYVLFISFSWLPFHSPYHSSWLSTPFPLPFQSLSSTPHSLLRFHPYWLHKLLNRSHGFPFTLVIIPLGLSVVIIHSHSLSSLLASWLPFDLPLLIIPIGLPLHSLYLFSRYHPSWLYRRYHPSLCSRYHPYSLTTSFPFKSLSSFSLLSLSSLSASLCTHSSS